MSVKTRIEALEKRLAKNEPTETVVQITVIVVRTRAEVEQLRAAGLMEPPSPSGQLIPRRPVRVVIKQTVDAKDWLAARDAATQDEEQVGSDASES